MILPELFLSTSLISIAIFVWAIVSNLGHSAKPSEQRADKEKREEDKKQEEGDGEEEEEDEEEEEEEGSEEMELESDKQLATSSSSSSSSSGCGDSVKDETPLSSTPGTPKAASGLSRRQRKNRKRDKEEKAKGKKPTPPLSRTNSEELRAELNRTKKRSIPCKQYSKLNLSDQELYHLLCGYLLTLDQMRQLGFPMDSSLYPGKAYIYRDPDFASIFPDGEAAELDDGDFSDQGREYQLDVNAEPFVPVSGIRSKDSTGIGLNATAKEFVPSKFEGVRWEPSLLHATESLPSLVRGGSEVEPLVSVASSPQLLSEATSSPAVATAPPVGGSSSSSCTFSRLPAAAGAAASGGRSSVTSSKKRIEVCSSEGTVSWEVDVDEEVLGGEGEEGEEEEERRCVRCRKTFFMLKSGAYTSYETCSYHWGKLRSKNKHEAEYLCCGFKSSSRGGRAGCCLATQHVWTGLPLAHGIFGPLDGYVKTKFRRSYPAGGASYGMFGLDCEMCYTVEGLEVTKVTVVGIDGRMVYESLVLPENEIIDYNTRFSGITARDLEKSSTKRLKEVQNDLNGFINGDSILIGHGLENDLRALKILHSRVIDTSLVFPHFYGLPYRRSLRSLVSSYLKRDIQGSAWGHDSYEDARASVELILWKTRKDVEKSRISSKI